MRVARQVFDPASFQPRGKPLGPQIGAQQPQIRPYAGTQGLTWGEEGSGPWEAFVSGHPAKRGRSQTIISKAAAMLGGQASFADGGFHPSHLANLMASGNVQRALSSSTTYNGPTVHVTANYPIAEPTSVTANRALQGAAALGRL